MQWHEQTHFKLPGVRIDWEWGQWDLVSSVDGCTHHSSFISTTVKTKQRVSRACAVWNTLLWGGSLLVQILSYRHTYTIPILPKNTNQLHCFLQRATRLTIQTTPSAWRQRGVRELQRGRALLSRLKSVRGCQQATNALLSLQTERKHKMETLPDPVLLQ